MLLLLHPPWLHAPLLRRQRAQAAVRRCVQESKGTCAYPSTADSIMQRALLKPMPVNGLFVARAIDLGGHGSHLRQTVRWKFGCAS